VRLLVSTFCLLLALAAPAAAAVTITFYSHKLRMIDSAGTDFPHGFVLLSGTTDAGEQVDTNLGFSARSIFINILWEKVEGRFDEVPLPPGYVEGARRHFAFPLSDAQYRAVMAVVETWRNAKQPSYDIDTHNCVIFVKEIAIAAGLAVSDDAKFIHAPGDLLDDAAARNAAFLAGHGNTPIAASAAPTDITTLQNRVRQLDRAAQPEPQSQPGAN
jgi:hypothetical protein